MFFIAFVNIITVALEVVTFWDIDGSDNVFGVCFRNLRSALVRAFSKVSAVRLVACLRVSNLFSLSSWMFVMDPSLCN